MTKLAICFSLLIAVGACSKSVEGETKRWDSANRKVAELSALYPGFKTALEEQRAKATAAMDAAKQVAGKEAQIEAMASANNLLTLGFVGQLADVDAKIKRIRRKAIDVPQKATDQADRTSARAAADQATQIITSVEAQLRQGAPAVSAAKLVLRKVSNDLREAESGLDRVARVAKGKDQAKKKAEKAAGAAGAGKAGKTGDKAPAEATWTCEYCDSVNQASANSCHNCGAARGKK